MLNAQMLTGNLLNFLEATLLNPVCKRAGSGGVLVLTCICKILLFIIIVCTIYSLFQYFSEHTLNKQSALNINKINLM